MIFSETFAIFGHVWTLSSDSSPNIELVGVRMGGSDGRFGRGSYRVQMSSELVGVRTKFVRSSYELKLFVVLHT